MLFHEVSWSEFEAILEELGEHRATRVAYLNSTEESDIFAILPCRLLHLPKKIALSQIFQGLTALALTLH